MAESGGKNYFLGSSLAFILAALLWLFVTLSSIVILSFIFLGITLAVAGSLVVRLEAIDNKLEEMKKLTTKQG